MPKKLFYLLASLLVLAVALYFISQNSGNTLKTDQTEFAVTDTASITKIFIADTQGNSTLLKRINGEWYLDEEGENMARKDAVDYILKILPTLSIKAPVATNSVPAMIERLNIFHKKVEIYFDGEQSPSKTIYIGDATQDHYGNLALLETKKNGKGKTPYYIQSDGKRGHLSPIFFTNELEWAHTSVFEFKPEEIKRIAVNYPEFPGKSFEIVKQDTSLMVKNPKTEAKGAFDKFFTEVYLNNYEKVFYETEDYILDAQQTDSLLQIIPFATITVETTKGTKSISLIRKKSEISTIDLVEQIVPYDKDRCYGIFNNKIILCQYFTFDKLLLDYRDFFKE